MTFKRETPEVLGEPLPFETMHLTELIAEEIKAGRVTMNGMPAGSVLTYHDPCTLGRQLGVYDAPRDIINAIPGIHFSEMPRHGEDAFCCGAGSYVRYDFPELTEKAGLDRMDEAVKTGAGILVTTCTSCLSQFQQLRSQTKAPIQIEDLITLVNKLVQVKESVIE
jgi:heterodisulfide reductase subunit D